ncbi:hypothetical protein [Undibacterium danionis]|uniref:hypothetical protein n=1 Tax=Undibacterium danionis TaxID=1812100 RepID=UPI0036F3D1D3
MEHKLPSLSTPSNMSFAALFSAFICLIIGIKGDNFVVQKYTLVSFSFVIGLISVLWVLTAFKRLSSLVENLEKTPLNQHTVGIRKENIDVCLSVSKIWLSRARKALVAGFVWSTISILSISSIAPIYAAPLLFLVLSLVSVNLGFIIAFTFIPGRNHDQYYSIPGSRNEHGHHRCVFCGNRGIYKHGQYKSNSTWHDCSKCGENLYIS